MNTVYMISTHKVFQTYRFDVIEFKYSNINIRIWQNTNELHIKLKGNKKINNIKNVMFDIYDLLFIMLGGYPQRLYYYENEVEVDTSEWVNKYETSNHFLEAEARICDISDLTICANTLKLMDLIHRQSLNSIAYVVCDYYGHIVSNHRVELISHTIEGVFIHTPYKEELLKKIRLLNKHKKKLDYIDIVERVFNLFFKYHRKYNCELLKCMHIKSKKQFYSIISDTRNDFSHLLEKKTNRLLRGSYMVYFVDLIFFAERMFIIYEILNLPLCEKNVQEYLYILHDWLNENINNNTNNIKSDRYKIIDGFSQLNRILVSEEK